jgi:hypothetical protein
MALFSDPFDALASLQQAPDSHRETGWRRVRAAAAPIRR